VAEVYGQTEGCGPTTMNRPGRIRIGTVGEPLPGVAIRIAPDGEVLVRGGNVCAGYYREKAATEALLGVDGWMRSGDAGNLDDQGYLHITGRKKDLLITSSGKNVAPQELETCLAAEPLISQAVVVGDRRPYLTALIALDVDAAIVHLDGGNGRAHAEPIDVEILTSHPVVQRELDRSIHKVNTGRAPIERIKSWRVLPHELTVSNGELTPTMKVRRETVAGRFTELIAEMYQTDTPSAAGAARARTGKR
jgi:long-chain acyl-CoA synthetase